MNIRKITKLPLDIGDLVHESETEGFAFINRLVAEWEDAVNRFDAGGEFLLLASEADLSVGLCGVNIDPYLSDQSVARLRHLYVLPAYRSQSVGSDLVRACMENLSEITNVVRLRVPEENTGRFYEKLGFRVVDDSTATHVFQCK